MPDPSDRLLHPGGTGADGDSVMTRIDDALDIDPDHPVDGPKIAAGSDGPDDIESPRVRSAIEWIVVVVGAVTIALLVRAFLFQPFWIPSESMEHTLLKQDRVMVNKLSYRLHDINRGDIIVFRRPDSDPNGYENLIKRVMGVGGDTIEGRDGAVWVNGERLDEPYLDPANVITDFGPVTVPAGQLFMMGDNRDDSYDSRFFGTVPVGNVVGRAFVLFWPLDRIGTL
jgi:signal peptidase I